MSQTFDFHILLSSLVTWGDLNVLVEKQPQFNTDPSTWPAEANETISEKIGYSHGCYSYF